MPKAYYNDSDPRVAAWLRELIAAGHLPVGDVDERSITDVDAMDLDGYDQVHLFAGIGGWALALQLARWPNGRAVWTGSCPCQPFSVAGEGRGTADERHLWPAFRRLVEQRRPAVVFGEQVTSPLGRTWLTGVRADLEALGYAVGAADLCAAGAGQAAEGWIVRGCQGGWEPIVLAAPHIRQRLYWVADAKGPRHAWSEYPRALRQEEGQRARLLGAGGHSPTGGLGDACAERLPAPQRQQLPREEGGGEGRAVVEPGRACWSDFFVTPCRDGRTRRFGTGAFPLADGIPGRVGLLRGYGNAIVPQIAAQFVEAWLDTDH